MSDTETQNPATPTSEPVTNPFARFAGGQMQAVFEDATIFYLDICDISPIIGTRDLIVKGNLAWYARFIRFFRIKLGASAEISHRIWNCIFREKEGIPSISGRCILGPWPHCIDTRVTFLLPGDGRIQPPPENRVDLDVELEKNRHVRTCSFYDATAKTLTIPVMVRDGHGVHLSKLMVFTTRWSDTETFSIEFVRKFKNGDYEVTGSRKVYNHQSRYAVGVGATIQEAIDNCD